MSRHPISHTKTVESKLAEEYVNFLIDEAIMNAMDIDDVKRETSGDKTMQKSHFICQIWLKVRNEK